MKRNIIIIVCVILVTTIFIFLKLNSIGIFNLNSNKLGSISNIGDGTGETSEDRMNKSGDEGILTDETFNLTCIVYDENNCLIGTDFLPTTAMLSYVDKITDYLESNGYTGTLPLYVNTNSTFRNNQYYYFSFTIGDTNKTISCIYNELTLSYDFEIS